MTGRHGKAWGQKEKGQLSLGHFSLLFEVGMAPPELGTLFYVEEAKYKAEKARMLWACSGVKVGKQAPTTLLGK